MEVIVNRRRMYSLFDDLLERRQKNLHPYNTASAILPQKVIPDWLRKDKAKLALFYFLVCLYMRGGIESLTAFKMLVKLCEKHPWLLEPDHVVKMNEEEVSAVLKTGIGWDSKAAGQFLRRNFERLRLNWNGDPLNLIKGLRNYDEALRRIANKKSDRRSTPRVKTFDTKEDGFWGFQAKMVSMLLYFYDWEGWIQPRFLYPSPADFHHYRLALSVRGIEIKTNNGREIRYTEKISGPYRKVLLDYMKERRADPIVVADALWLFSLLMCGESPATRTNVLRDSPSMFSRAGVEEVWDHGQWLNSRSRVALSRTCGVCALESRCQYAIPAQPYYRKGQLIMRPRQRLLATYVADKLPDEIDQDTSDQFSLFEGPDG